MKNLLFAALLMIGSQLASAQSNVVFFTENGEKFQVVLNGVLQNETPQTNVRINGLTPTYYRVKVMFEVDTIRDVDGNIEAPAGKEVNYMLTERIYDEGRKAQGFAAKMAKKLNYQTEAEEFLGVKEPEKDDALDYVIRFYSEAEIATPETTTGSTGTTTVGGTGGQAVVHQETTTITTETSTPDVHHHNTNVHVEESGSSTSMTVNWNVNSSTHTSHSHTTTTVTETHVHESEPNPMPGYSGRVGCDGWPMAESNYRDAKSSISEKDFSSSKMSMAKQVAKSNCLTASQVKGIVEVFDFESDRLEFAKFAYDYTYDIDNYYKVNDAFEFESSIEELSESIGY